MKKRICLLLALVMPLCMVSVSSVSAATLTAEPVYVYINNEPLKIEAGRMGALLFKETGSTMVPLSKTMGDQIKSIREWAKIRARKASNTTWEDDNIGVRQLEIGK